MLADFDSGPFAPCPAPFNFAQYVLEAGASRPDKIALAVLTVSGAERWSFGKLRAAVLGTATGLLQAGAQPGDRVLMRLGNTIDFPITYLAALAIDLIPVPTSAQLTAREISKIASEVAPSLIVAADGVALPDPLVGDVVTLTQLRDMRDLPAAAFVMGDPERPAYVIYTSGTSGAPRGVLHAHRAIWARRMMWDGWYGLREADRLLHAGAFNWTYTLGTGLMDPWTIGATALIPGADVTPQQLPLLLKRHDATIFAAAPGVYRQMMRANVGPLPKLRHGLCAGEKLTETIRQEWTEATGTALHEAYGMSECSTFVSGRPERPAPPDTLGYPQPGRHLAVIADDQIAGVDTPGTLAVAKTDPGLCLAAGDDVMKVLAGEATADQGDWFLTGDTVSMAADGAVTYLGRGDDMMNAGGFRVSPIEVEQVLTTHRDIQECAAAEVQVKADASVIALFYVAEHDIVGLDAFAAGLLARYKTPRIFRRIDALPKGGNGKILRRALRENFKV